MDTILGHKKMKNGQAISRFLSTVFQCFNAIVDEAKSKAEISGQAGINSIPILLIYFLKIRPRVNTHNGQRNISTYKGRW